MINKDLGLGLAVAGAALLAGGVAWAMSSSSKTTTTTPATPGQTIIFAVGHRYKLSFAYSYPITAPSTAKVQSLTDLNPLFGAAAGVVHIVSVTQVDPTHIDLTFDILKALPNMTVNTADVAAFGEADSLTVADLGLTPGGAVNPPSSASSWTRTTSVKTGDRVRISVQAYDFSQIAAALGVSATVAGFQQVLQSPVWQALLHAQGITVWGPGAANLPADWPTDDAAASTEYHAEFLYGGGPLSALSVLPFPLLMWTQSAPAQGGGAQGGSGGQGVNNILATVVPLFTKAKSSVADASGALGIASATALALQQSNVDPQARSVAAQWRAAATQRQTDAATLAGKIQQTIGLFMAPNLANPAATIKGAALGLGLSLDTIAHGLLTDSAQATTYASAGPSPAADVGKQWASANLAIQTKLSDAAAIFTSLS